LKSKDWFIFILLGAIWSASFLWIKIAVSEIGPFALVAFRVTFGALTGILITLFARTKWPRQRATWLTFGLLGVTSVAIPFVLISWGEKTIDSAVASILNAGADALVLPAPCHRPDAHHAGHLHFSAGRRDPGRDFPERAAYLEPGPGRGADRQQHHSSQLATCKEVISFQCSVVSNWTLKTDH